MEMESESDDESEMWKWKILWNGSEVKMKWSGVTVESERRKWKVIVKVKVESGSEWELYFTFLTEWNPEIHFQEAAPRFFKENYGKSPRQHTENVKKNQIKWKT